VADGSTIEDVADAFTISIFTARNHIASLERKLGARSRLELVLQGMRAGLI
jgi:DNA-binding CsgD family transcriptional regulator